ncbi:MAG: DUF131 domain-containing protein [Desulfurococcaceae archaeon]
MKLFKTGLTLIFAGIILMFIAVIIPFLSIAGGEIKVSAGGCILIGFIPICFGVGESALKHLLIALILSIVVIVVAYMLILYVNKEIKKFTGVTSVA